MKKLFPILLVLLLLVSLTACSADSGNYVPEDNDFIQGTDKNEIGSTDSTSAYKGNAKIIRNVTLEAETTDFDGTIEKLKSKIVSLEGYVENSRITGGESYGANYISSRRAVYTLRIPADKLDSFLAETENMLNILAQSESTEDVTLSYYDIQSRISVLESKKAALEQMLEKAETFDEILAVQDSLYQVIGDIESYQSQLNVYDSKVNFSTVSLTVTEVVELTEKAEPTFGSRIASTFVGSWQLFGEFCQWLVIVFVGALPIICTLAVIVLVIWLIVLLAKKSRKKKDN